MKAPKHRKPLISTIIPVKNGAKWLPEAIAGILNQKLANDTEIIVIDSGSTDSSLEILRKLPVKLIQIAASEFNHGTTRNLGIQQATGEFVVMTVQDAVATDDQWLTNLLQPFSDATVAGVCGQQVVPHLAGNNPIDWFRPISAPISRKYYFPDKDNFDKLSNIEKAAICRWDDVNAMYRRQSLLRLPFKRVDFAEDVLWCRDALLNGLAIVYEPLARVNHYHFETPEYVYRRTFSEFYHFFKIFDTLPNEVANGPVEVLKNLKLLTSISDLSWADKWQWLKFNYHRRVAINKSVKAFRSSVLKGKSSLENKYAEVVKIPVQALNPSLS